MGRGGAIYLSYTALVLLSALTPASAGLWDVDIDLSPAPSPEDGPPFSAHATRNRSLLPYQIIGVVASYLATVFIVGILLLTVGRRLRKRARTMADRPTEMTKPMFGAFEQSPISPHKVWGSLRSKKSTASSLRSRSNYGSPDGQNTFSFDRDVIENDRRKAQEQMAQIYGTLWEDEEQKLQHTVSTTELPRSHPGVPTLSIPRPDRPDLQRVRTSDSFTYSPTSPISPNVSYRAIYPYNSPSNTSGPGQTYNPTSPITTQSAQRTRATSFTNNKTPEATAGPVPSKQTVRKSIKNLKISAPIQRLRNDDNHDDARTPLSPSFYTDPGLPPEPPTSRTLDSQGYPVTPGSTVTADFVGAYDVDLDEVRDLPQAYPQRLPQQIPESPERRRGGNATNANANLPFREKYGRNNLRPQNYPPMSPGHLYPQSAGPTVTTFVDAPRSHLAAPLTGAETPYSPYFVGAVITPVTPNIMSREERKQRRKEERATKGAIMEEDLVADEKDLWSSGY